MNKDYIEKVVEELYKVVRKLKKDSNYINFRINVMGRKNTIAKRQLAAYSKMLKSYMVDSENNKQHKETIDFGINRQIEKVKDDLRNEINKNADEINKLQKENETIKNDLRNEINKNADEINKLQKENETIKKQLKLKPYLVLLKND